MASHNRSPQSLRLGDQPLQSQSAPHRHKRKAASPCDQPRAASAGHPRGQPAWDAEVQHPSMAPSSGSTGENEAQSPGPPSPSTASLFEPPCPVLPLDDMNRMFRPTGRVLGSGHFGVVREVKNVRTGERFACKTIRAVRRKRGDEHGWLAPGPAATERGADVAAPASSMEDVEREAGFMHLLGSHPGMLKLRGIFASWGRGTPADIHCPQARDWDDREGAKEKGEEKEEGVEEDNGEGEVHLVMDLCEGGDLFDEVVRQGRFSEAQAALVLLQLISAIAWCHSHGVVHRDLKPENILLVHQSSPPPSCTSPRSPFDQSPDDDTDTAAKRGRFDSPTPLAMRVKLVDFGLAKHLNPGEKTQGMAGSPFYMAPEVIQGQYDSAADVWSLGVILYILLVGSPPFWGKTDEEVFKAVLRGHLDMDSDPWPQVSADAKDLCSSILCRDPESRPALAEILCHPWMLQQLRSVASSGKGTDEGRCLQPLISV